MKSMHVARAFPSAVIMNGYIYVAGGEVNQRATNVVEMYNPKSNEWKLLAPLNISRCSFALIQIYGFLYVIGGNSSAVQNVIEKYYPRKNCWMEVRVCVKSIAKKLTPTQWMATTSYLFYEYFFFLFRLHVWIRANV